MRIWVQLLGACFPKTWQGKKTSKILSDLNFGQLQTPIIALERIEISTSGERRCQLESLPRATKKSVKFGGLKTSEIRRDFGQLQTFDREYLWNRLSYRQAENGVINYYPSYIRRKGFGELWSTNHEIYLSNFDPPKITTARVV